MHHVFVLSRLWIITALWAGTEGNNQVAVSYQSTCALNGTYVWCWGRDALGTGVLGAGTSNYVLPSTTPIDLGDGFMTESVDCGYTHCCTVSTNNTLKCWGSNQYGQLGQGDTDNRGDDTGEMGDNLNAIDLGSDFDLDHVSCGGSHTCVYSTNHSIKCFGANTFGQLGNTDTANHLGDADGEMGHNLSVVNLGTDFVPIHVDCGESFSCALSSSGTVKCWGMNTNGQLGLADGTTSPRGDAYNMSPIDLGTGFNVSSIRCGGTHICALSDSHDIKCWGRNYNGELGLGDTTHRGTSEGTMGNALPVVDLGGNFIPHILGGGRYHNVAISVDGTVKAWGSNNYGQLGYGDSDDRGANSSEMGTNLAEIDLGTGLSAVAIAGGCRVDHSCAMLQNGTGYLGLKCWGYNYYYQLGVGGNSHRGDDADEMGDDLPFVFDSFSPLTTSMPTTTTIASPTEPTEAPTNEPSISPSAGTPSPSTDPSKLPTTATTSQSSSGPTRDPTTEPTDDPTTEPTDKPSADPTEGSSTNPTEEPSSSIVMSIDPTQEPTTEPTRSPSVSPFITEMNTTTLPSEESTVTTFSPSTGPTKTPTEVSTETPSPAPSETTPARDPTSEPKQSVTYVNDLGSNFMLIIAVAAGTLILCIVICVIVVLLSHRKLQQRMVDMFGDQVKMTNGLIVSVPIGQYQTKRDGAEVRGYFSDLPVERDVEHLKQLAEYLNYTFLTIEDKFSWTEGEVMDFMTNRVGSEFFGEDHVAKYDGLVVAFSGHGVKDHIVKSDLKQMDRTAIHRCVSNTFPKIREFPRVFLFDACDGSGDRKMTLVDAPESPISAIAMEHQKPRIHSQSFADDAKMDEEVEMSSMPTEMAKNTELDDVQNANEWTTSSKNPDYGLTVVHASNKGFVAKMQQGSVGSYLTYFFTKTVMQHHKTMGLAHILEQINEALHDNGKQQIRTEFFSKTRNLRFEINVFG